MLSTTTPHIGKRPYALLGRLLLRHSPELAQELLAAALLEAKPVASDYSLIPTYFTTFCTLHGLDPKAYIGPLRKSKLVDVRRLFIAVILRLYYPQALAHTTELVTMPPGLTKAISELFRQGKNGVSRTIHEVILAPWDSTYGSLEERADQIVHQILSHDSTQA
ncbi:hypothetical protein [Flaviaesturariibacter amylovorans]|uniref:Uncharacterized protein n=1 Tax=Flaviaesturariibacter amylovorans TaxID=1084520 RepID=A0ABP8GQG9_9BACT